MFRTSHIRMNTKNSTTLIAIINLTIPHMQNRIFSVIQQKQNGKCRHCRRNITLVDTVVSNGNGWGY